ncbi:MAG: hypothetical protein ACE5HI_09620 [bacterium]
MEFAICVGAEKLAEMALIESMSGFMQSYSLHVNVVHTVISPGKKVAVINLPQGSVELPVVINVSWITAAVNPNERESHPQDAWP